MKSYFECRLRYDKMQSNGAVRKVTEAFLVEALTFTDAEATVTERMRPCINGAFSVAAIRRTKIAEVFVTESDKRWYIVKTAFVSFDEKSGKEKKSITQMLVGADDPDQAMGRLYQLMKGTASDYTVEAILDTPYVDVFLSAPEAASE